MTTLGSLKAALLDEATSACLQATALSDAQYKAGFNVLMKSGGSATHQNFIIPQLSQLLTRICKSQRSLSVLEIGPGAESVLGYLPSFLRRNIRKYTALEPNVIFASELEQLFSSDDPNEWPLPCLESQPAIHKIAFAAGENAFIDENNDKEKFDVILFCHSMYGLKPKRKFVERAFDFLTEKGMTIVFHREGSAFFDGLVAHRTASFPTGILRVRNEDEILDEFASFIAGFTAEDAYVSTQLQWRNICRKLGTPQDTDSDHLVFSSPEIMIVFNQHATKLPELTTLVPSLPANSRIVKNPEARLRRPAAIITPKRASHVQQCVGFAKRYDLSMTVLGGGHSGHCIVENAVAVDMSRFNKIHIISGAQTKLADQKVIAEVGCQAGEVVRRAIEYDRTVPLGARPTVGAGLWLQGGIGHLARQYGLTCDAIVGAVLVTVESSELIFVGDVPNQHRHGAERAINREELFWTTRGAGTNFGIVISITFKTYPALTHLVHRWTSPLRNDYDIKHGINNLYQLIGKSLPSKESLDMYLYSEGDQLILGATLTESYTKEESRDLTDKTVTRNAKRVSNLLGREKDSRVANGIELFDTELYMSGMHGGHGGGKTSSFKRCFFFKAAGLYKIIDVLTAAMQNRPSRLCYFHLMQGGGAVAEIRAGDTAFGCRDWDLACVVTGVWKRQEDGTNAARAAIQWVYDVVQQALPYAIGIYGADLGPDPRDADLALQAFGPNGKRLAELKNKLDPHGVLGHACPILTPQRTPDLIILVAGESAAGKDYCADIWANVFGTDQITARAVSISDATKREYATATGTNFWKLLHNRQYKEQHRPKLTEFFKQQVDQRPELPKDHFLQIIQDNPDLEVLMITGMRDESPVARFSHLVPNSRVIELRVDASEEMRDSRKGNAVCEFISSASRPTHRPTLVFDNNSADEKAVEGFAKRWLLPYCSWDLRRLANMVRSIPDFPRDGVNFQHILNISQEPGGLDLFNHLAQEHYTGDLSQISAIACCESGGFIFGSALATALNRSVPLIPIREAGKLPPPTVSVEKTSSYISSMASGNAEEKRIEMNLDILPEHGSILVVDDVLSTGHSLGAMLELLKKAGVEAENISVMVVAEFPVHRGRDLLVQRGFGSVSVQSLLVFGCA